MISTIIGEHSLLSDLRLSPQFTLHVLLQKKKSKNGSYYGIWNYTFQKDLSPSFLWTSHTVTGLELKDKHLRKNSNCFIFTLKVKYKVLSLNTNSAKEFYLYSQNEEGLNEISYKVTIFMWNLSFLSDLNSPYDNNCDSFSTTDR